MVESVSWIPKKPYVRMPGTSRVQHVGKGHYVCCLCSGAIRNKIRGKLVPISRRAVKWRDILGYGKDGKIENVGSQWAHKECADKAKAE